MGCGKCCSSHTNNSCSSCGVRAPIARSTSWRVFGLMDFSILPGLGRAAKATVVRRRCLDFPPPSRVSGQVAGQRNRGTDGTYPLQKGLRINPGGFVSELLDVFDIGAGIDGGMAVGAAFAAQFQHA